MSTPGAPSILSMGPDQCADVMCSEKLQTTGDAKKWLLKHHPDKGAEPTAVDIGLVGSCMMKKQFCTAKAATVASRKSTRKARSGEMRSLSRVFQKAHMKPATRGPSTIVNAYKPNARQLQCIRHVSNWSKIGPSNRFNKKKFSVEDTDKLIPIASPKLEAMLQNIEALDKNDMLVFGKTFKHFIFSDIKLLGYGAKIISAGLIARNWKNILKPEVRKTRKGNSKPYIVVDVPKGSAGRNFAVLSSTPMWDAPFSHALKKEVLTVYNKRPDNVYGEDCRLIVLDSGFKEGIDLFDVRYVHLFEPLMTAADQTQSLGRATRLCGQKGLNFVPQQGWPLHVFKYSQSIPESLQGAYKAMNLFEIMLQLKGLDTRLHRITKCIQDVSILAAVDQPLTEEIHKSGLLPKMDIKRSSGPLTVESILTQNVMPMTPPATRANFVNSKAKTMLLLEDKKNDEVESIADVESDPCSPRDPSNCNKLSMVPFAPSRLSQRSIVPSVVMESNMLVVRVPSAAPMQSRGVPTTWFDLRRYVSEKFGKMAWGKQEIVNKCGGGSSPSRAASPKAPPPSRAASPKAPPPSRESSLKAATASAKPKAASAKPKAASAKPKAASAKPKAASVSPKAASVKPKAASVKPKAATAPAKKTVKAVKAIKSVKTAVKTAKAKTKRLPALKLIDYTPTQDFISSYFTVASPIKGMLLWHSVGTGKTCTAIALCSRQFEPAGYTIIWVTRHTLKADIWKNIFEQVCHKVVADEVRAGKLLPQDVEKRQKKMFQQWIPPMSYRQFSNLVTKKNPLYKVLESRNGKEDPLKKTLIVIDEAHKLYSSDFKGAEKPDVPAFMAALQNSYSKSGRDSARVLLMTATPYNESPMELMSLLNLCREKKNALPENIPAFVEKYMDETGNFSKEGIRKYMDDIAGQISYLNREADPSQFAQPVFADIVVPLSTFDMVDVGGSEKLKELRDAAAALEVELAELDGNTIPYLESQVQTIQPAYDSHLRECVDNFTSQKDIKACQKRVHTEYKAALKLENKNLKAARSRSLKITKEQGKFEKKYRSATAKLRKTGPASFTQQAQLEGKCKLGDGEKKKKPTKKATKKNATPKAASKKNATPKAASKTP